ncbi:MULTISPECIES: flagellar biosynthesis protein FlhB [Marinomonas]|uniref:Flagellar biosynthetic protein FlhB n=1 Tax=Marinomonas polaris DSM 16579 TaxID=1122206 RepID=A0A1M5JIX3_9GAMM|nr:MULTISPECIES: flagellar biosynthesis protein FlhB [Marinomonas]PJE55256.1 flagellar biosynthesis protein FlhB [Marinomonas sp. BSi20584]SHG40209.1 flagellar biosynthetic protein FlhB [Marinomonas polaris DSM 16579]|tara:strand:- start:5317 stop:6453 length:1137 start_codon:yes stop_codon:yes gene_type:complete
MAENEDGSEKTESASSKKLQDARNKGNLPRSKDLSSALLLIVAAATIYGTGTLLVRDLAVLFDFNFLVERADVFDLSRMVFHLYESVVAMMDSMVLLMAVLAVAGIVGSIALGGLNFSWEPLTPKLSKMSPIAGLKRMFSVQSLVELFKSIAKVTLVGFVAVVVLNYFLPEMLGLTFQSMQLAITHGIDIVIWSFVFVTLALALIAAIDVPFQVWSHKEKLKMTKQEVKDEYKQQEGDPLVRGRIRQMQRQAAMNRMMSDVPSADVIITNPTHFSVALKYDQTGGAAPVLLAKGGDFIALKIREVGNHYDIPVIQSPALARAIYHHTKIGDEIPQGLFKVVAQLLAYVYQLRNARMGAPRPETMPNLDVPDEFQWDGS